MIPTATSQIISEILGDRYLIAEPVNKRLMFSDSDEDFQDVMKDDQCIYPEGFTIWASKCGVVSEVMPTKFFYSGEQRLQVTNATMKYHVDIIVALLRKHCPGTDWRSAEFLDVFTQAELDSAYDMWTSRGQEVVLKDPNELYHFNGAKGRWYYNLYQA